MPEILNKQERTYRTAEVAKMTGVSLRQLQWWDERGLVVPDIESHSRHYSAQQLKEVKVIASLCRKRISFQKIRKFFPKVRQALSSQSGEDSILLVDNHFHGWVMSPTAALQFALASMSPVIVVALN